MFNLSVMYQDITCVYSLCCFFCIIMATDNVCKTCQKKVQSFSYKICCMNCKITFHAKRVHSDKDDIHDVNFWHCSYCLGDKLFYNHIDDGNELYFTILEGMLDCPFNVHDMSKKVFIPFEINDEFDTPLTEIDPDMQFYLESIYIKNTKREYYTEDTFLKNISSPENSIINVSYGYKKSIEAFWWITTIPSYARIWIFCDWHIRDVVEWK